MFFKSFFTFKNILYRNMFISFLLAIGVAIISISTLLYVVFSNKAVDNIISNNESMIYQATINANLIIEDITEASYSLENTTDIISVLYSDKISSLKNYRAIEHMRDILKVYPYIEHISIYNSITDHFLSTRGLSMFEQIEPTLKTHINNYTGKNVQTISHQVTSNLTSTSSATKKIQVISFMIPTTFKNNFIIIDIKQEQFVNLFSHMDLKESFLDDVYICNNNGVIISSLYSEKFMDKTNYKILKLYKNIENGLKSEKLVMQNIPYMATISPLEYQNWFFVGLINYNNVKKELNSLKSYVIIIGMSLLFFSIIYTFFTTRKLYKPINLVLKKIKNTSSNTKNIDEIGIITKAIENAAQVQLRMQKSLHEYENNILDNELQHLILKGFYHHPKAKETISKKLSNNYFLICTMQLSKEEGLKTYIANEFILNSLADYSPVIISNSPNEFIIVLQSNVSSFDNVKSHIISLETSMFKQFDIDFCAGIGIVVDNINTLNESYLTSIEALNYALLEEKSKILEYICCQTKKHLNQYPVDIEKKIFDSITKKNENEIHKNIQNFYMEIRQNSYLFAKIHSIQLLQSIFNTYHKILIYVDFDEVKFYHYIINTHKLSEIFKSLTSMCIELSNVLGDSTQHQVVVDTKKWIESHYKEDDICLATASSKIGLTPSYLNRLFKKQYGLSFSEYVNYLRIEKAKDLLLKTNLTTNEICSKIGILNTNYFYTLFKKQTGYTPTQFRKI